MADATAGTMSRKGKGTRSSSPWDVVERYADFLVEKFGQRISATLWEGTKTECAELGIKWLSSDALKGCLSHYAACSFAPEDVRARASALIKQLSRPDLLDPWKILPNKACPYCFKKDAAIVALSLEDES
jgi:hypothetical protein